MEKIILVATNPPKARRDDGLVDRLNSRYTVMMLVAFAVIISFTQWVGRPMQCWVPKHFTGSHTKYANSFCWVNNTYYLPFHEYIPRPHEDDKRHTIYYYQWIPWILLSQAFFFWFPSVVWHGFNSKAGVDSDDILQAAYKLQSAKQEEKHEAKLRLLCNQLDRFLTARSDRLKKWAVYNRRTSGYLVGLYLLSKVLYLANILFQMYTVGGLLNTEFERFAHIFIDFYHGNASDPSGEFLNSMTFPRVTMCDFNIRILGNNQRYTVQCCLPLNLYLEKMYLIFWFWLVFLMFFTAADLLIWFMRSVLRGDRLNFVRNHLNSGMNINSEKDHIMAAQFLDEYLQQDGAFVLRMISHNTNSATTADVVGKLFEMWKTRQSKKHTWSNEDTEMTDLVEYEKEKGKSSNHVDDPHPV